MTALVEVRVTVHVDLRTLQDPLDDGSVPVYHDPVPVVVGHYWREFPLGLEAPHVACVDYSAGKGGPLVAYRWHHGDERLADDRFVWA